MASFTVVIIRIPIQFLIFRCLEYLYIAHLELTFILSLENDISTDTELEQGYVRSVH